MILGRAVGASNSDPSIFVTLVEASRAAAKAIEMPDPLEPFLRWALERAVEVSDTGPEDAANYLSILTSELVGESQSVARRVLFALENDP